MINIARLARTAAAAAALSAVAVGGAPAAHATAALALEGGGHLRREGRRDEPRPKGDEERQPARLCGKGRRGQPRVLAPRAGRGQHAGEARGTRTCSMTR